MEAAAMNTDTQTLAWEQWSSAVTAILDEMSIGRSLCSMYDFRKAFDRGWTAQSAVEDALNIYF
jgi:hypothetical protein